MLNSQAGVKGVESGSRLNPEWTDEASSTLPPREEEPLIASYAAAGRIDGAAGGFGSSERARTRGGIRESQANSAAAGGGMALMVCVGLHSEKSLSLMKMTAKEAVVYVVPLKRPKAVEMGGNELCKKRGQHCRSLVMME